MLVHLCCQLVDLLLLIGSGGRLIAGWDSIPITILQFGVSLALAAFLAASLDVFLSPSAARLA